jgi:Phage protein Gp138 N-terminal domain
MSTGPQQSDSRDQEQKVSSLEEAFAAQIDRRMKEIHTSVPGIIQSYNPDTQTATAQPAIKRVFVEKGPVDLPLCVDVPVSFPGGGGFHLTFPVGAGDECMLIFSERAIDHWHDKGGTQLPAEYRMHDMSDAMAVVGMNSQANKLSDVQTTGAELRTRDRSTFIRIEESGKIKIRGDIEHEGKFDTRGDMTIGGDVIHVGNLAMAGNVSQLGIHIATTHPNVVVPPPILPPIDVT